MSKSKLLVRTLFLIICILGLWFAIHTTYIIVDGLNDEIAKTDTGVVLGNKVQRNGQPSERLRARLDKAKELYENGYVKTVIVSGGVGKEGFDEAKVMKDYLVKSGIPSDKIIMDHNGYNTFMTAKNAKTIMSKHQMKSAMVITQYFHITRTELAFKKVGIKPVFSAHATFFEWRDIYSIIREFFAFYKYLVI